MIQIALLFLGAGFIRKNAYPLALIGLCWNLLGLFIFVDGLDGVRYFPLHFFGLIILTESAITLLLALGSEREQRTILFFKSGMFGFVALLVLSGKAGSDLVLAIIFGFAYFVTAILLLLSSWIVRFTHWKTTLLSGIAHLLFSFFLFTPYPTHYHDTISLFIGVTLLLGGLNTLRLALRMLKLTRGTTAFSLLVPRGLLTGFSDMQTVEDKHALPAQPELPPAGPLIVHVWTPAGTAASQPLRRPVVNRYIAAVDREGVISTGHAALEFPPDNYISLYPVNDIDRSPSEFFNTLKAVQENNVPGRFLPDYLTEVEDWCESDKKLTFYRYNAQSIMTFWQIYRQDTTYNLTWRNCSSTAAYGLEAALDGVFSYGQYPWWTFFRLFFRPELWLAAQLRRRAINMAWTPGLVLDYARLLHTLVHEIPLSLHFFPSGKNSGPTQGRYDKNQSNDSS